MTAAIADRLNIEMPDEEMYAVSELGEGLALDNRRTVEMTVDFALDFLDRYAEFSIGDEKIDRNLKNEHVVHLCREMLSGNFRWEQVNLVVCQLDGRWYRMNGQHTAWAVIYADDQGLDKKVRRPVQIMRYTAQTIADARRLYASLDRGLARGNAVVVKSHLLGTDKFPGYKSAHLAMLAQGLGCWLWESQTKRSLHGGDDRSYLLLTDHHRTALCVGTLLKESKAADIRHMKRAPVIGAMFETASKAPQISLDFWRIIRDGIGIADKEDPRLVLRNYLMSTSLAKSQVTNGDYKIVSQEEQYRACVYAWNAFRTDRKMKRIQVDLSLERPSAR